MRKNIMPIEANKKPVEIVHELKDEYKIPSFEEFMKNYESDEEVVRSYDDELRNYKNLREFNCEAPWEQWKEVWQKVGEKLEQELNNGGNTTRWLNTHGLWVHHLHIRLDKSPKYYQGAEEYQVDNYQSNIEVPSKEFPSRGWNKW